MTRPRIRDLGIIIGEHPPGPLNAITDVPGVLVGHQTLIYDEPRIARTGVTMIIPRDRQSWTDYAFGAYHVFNGTGEMTGVHWLTESGLLCGPIGLTNTHQIGLVHDAMITYARLNKLSYMSALPIVAETYDGWLSDVDAFPLTETHVYEALNSASGGPVVEGCVGGGTGMICHDFKGGIGTASRRVDSKSGPYMVGALVQANHGDRSLLRIDGLPVGREIGLDHTPSPWAEPPQGGSIIVIIATDAPLLPSQCRRLAQRATVGLARVGGVGYNGSGDIFLVFATGNHYPANADAPVDLQMLPQHHLNPFFEAVAEAVEEAILNALTAAETTTGFKGRTAHALPLDELERVMAKYNYRR